MFSDPAKLFDSLKAAPFSIGLPPIEILQLPGVAALLKRAIARNGLTVSKTSSTMGSPLARLSTNAINAPAVQDASIDPTHVALAEVRSCVHLVVEIEEIRYAKARFPTLFPNGKGPL